MSDARTLPSFLGPASVVGVCLGSVLIGLPLWQDAASWWLWWLPLLGLPLLALPGALRHFGTGLLASIALVPALSLGWVGLIVLFELGTVG